MHLSSIRDKHRVYSTFSICNSALLQTSCCHLGKSKSYPGGYSG